MLREILPFDGIRRHSGVGWIVLTVAQLMLTVILTDASHAGADEPKPYLAWGKELFETHCARCHGADGTGKGPAAGSLATPPADLTRISKAHGGKFPRLEIVRFIDGERAVSAHRSDEMPPWGRVFKQRPGGAYSSGATSPEIYAITDYIASIQKR